MLAGRLWVVLIVACATDFAGTTGITTRGEGTDAVNTTMLKREGRAGLGTHFATGACCWSWS